MSAPSDHTRFGSKSDVLKSVPVTYMFPAASTAVPQGEPDTATPRAESNTGAALRTMRCSSDSICGLRDAKRRLGFRPFVVRPVARPRSRREELENVMTCTPIERWFEVQKRNHVDVGPNCCGVVSPSPRRVLRHCDCSSSFHGRSLDGLHSDVWETEQLQRVGFPLGEQVVYFSLRCLSLATLSFARRPIGLVVLLDREAIAAQQTRRAVDPD